MNFWLLLGLKLKCHLQIFNAAKYTFCLFSIELSSVYKWWFEFLTVVHFCCCTEQINALLEQQEKLCERQSELKDLLEQNESSRKHGVDEASVSSENWSGSFEWDSEADDVRFNVFGISAYRANQREVGATYLNIMLNYLFITAIT